MGVDGPGEDRIRDRAATGWWSWSRTVGSGRAWDGHGMLHANDNRMAYGAGLAGDWPGSEDPRERGFAL